MIKNRFDLGKRFKSNNGGWCEIIKKEVGNRKVKVKFESDGNEVWVDRSNLGRGSFKDYGLPTVWGVGYSYDGAVFKNKHAYRIWSRMLERCYGNKTSSRKYYQNAGVKVCERWLIFSNFEKDIRELRGYEKNIKNPFEYTLDKDLNGDGKLYCKESCAFISRLEQRMSSGHVSPIVSISKYGEKRDFPSINHACRALGVQNANVYKVLSGERKHTLGYDFKLL